MDRFFAGRRRIGEQIAAGSAQPGITGFDEHPGLAQQLAGRVRIEALRLEALLELADLALIVGHLDEELELFGEEVGRLDRVAPIGVKVNGTFGDGVVQQEDDGDDVVVRRRSLAHVGDGVARNKVTQGLGHQFDAFGRDLQSDFGRLAFLLFALEIPASPIKKKERKKGMI